MLDLINKILFYLKIFILLIVFTLTIYIMLSMDKYYSNSYFNVLIVSIPFFLLLVMFVFSFFLCKWKDNLLFNIACNLSLIAILIIDYRTIFDDNMVMWVNGNMNFYYFQNSLIQIKILGYGAFISHLLLVKHNKNSNKHI